VTILTNLSSFISQNCFFFSIPNDFRPPKLFSVSLPYIAEFLPENLRQDFNFLSKKFSSLKKVSQVPAQSHHKNKGISGYTKYELSQADAPL